MVYELVRNQRLTGSVIATSPQFNYMIGPSSEVLINIGARFIPCVLYPDEQVDPLTSQVHEAGRSPAALIRAVLLLHFQVSSPCHNKLVVGAHGSPPDSTCSIEEICGHGGFSGGEPDRQSTLPDLMPLSLSFINRDLAFLRPDLLARGHRPLSAQHACSGIRRRTGRKGDG